MMTKHCEYCEKPFEAKHLKRKYCSDTCKQMAYYKRGECGGVNGGARAMENIHLTLDKPTTDLETGIVKQQHEELAEGLYDTGVMLDNSSTIVKSNQEKSPDFTKELYDSNIQSDSDFIQWYHTIGHIQEENTPDFTQKVNVKSNELSGDFTIETPIVKQVQLEGGHFTDSKALPTMKKETTGVEWRQVQQQSDNVKLNFDNELTRDDFTIDLSVKATSALMDIPSDRTRPISEHGYAPFYDLVWGYYHLEDGHYRIELFIKHNNIDMQLRTVWYCIRLLCLIKNSLYITTFIRIDLQSLIYLNDAVQALVNSTTVGQLGREYPYEDLLKELAKRLEIYARYHDKRKATDLIAIHFKPILKAQLIAARLILQEFVHPIRFEELDFNPPETLEQMLKTERKKWEEEYKDSKVAKQETI